MNKQELIDKAINEANGLWGSDYPLLFVSGELNTIYPKHTKFTYGTEGAPTDGFWDLVCTVDEYKQRAKELGWISGYKWGIEYPTNSKKPDLSDDVLVEFKNEINGNFVVDTRKVIHIAWTMYKSNPVTAFRIVDERYKPVSEQPAEPKQDDWFARGELPPVGAVCEMLDADLAWRQVEILAYSKKGVVVEWNSKEFLQSKDRKFRPIKSEREKFIKKLSEVLHSTENGVINDISLGQAYDAGFRAPE